MKPTAGRTVLYYERGWPNEMPRVAIIVYVQGHLPTTTNEQGLTAFVDGAEADEKNYLVNLAVFHRSSSAVSDRYTEIVEYVDSVIFNEHKEGDPVGYSHWTWPPRV